MNKLNERSRIDLQQMSKQLKNMVQLSDLNELDQQIKEFWQKIKNTPPMYNDYGAPNLKNPRKVWCLHCTDVYDENEAVWEVRFGMDTPLWWCRNKSCNGAGVNHDLWQYKPERDGAYDKWLEKKTKGVDPKKREQVLERVKKPTLLSKMCYLEELREFTVHMHDKDRILDEWDVNCVMGQYGFVEMFFSMVENKCPIPDPFFVKLFSGSFVGFRVNMIFQGKPLNIVMGDTKDVLKALIKETEGKVPPEMLQFVRNHEHDFPAVEMLEIYTQNNLPVPYEIVEKLYEKEKNKALFKLKTGNLKPAERKELKKFIEDCERKEREQEYEEEERARQQAEMLMQEA